MEETHTGANVMRGAILLLSSYAFMATVKYNELATGKNRSHCARRYVPEHTRTAPMRSQEHQVAELTELLSNSSVDWAYCYRLGGGSKGINIF
jgi:hypothetical protein